LETILKIYFDIVRNTFKNYFENTFTKYFLKVMIAMMMMHANANPRGWINGKDS